MTKISACIITKNEEKFIRECLDSIKDVADEIVVVDDFSQDKTVDICKEYTDKIYKKKWQDFAIQRNFAISKTTGQWILIIDADERLSTDLRNVLKNLVEDKEYSCFAFSRRTYIKADYWVKHGRFYPDYQMRLLRKECLKYFGGVNHDIPTFEGKVKKLKWDLIHHQEDRNTVYNPEMYQEYVRYELKRRKRERSRIHYLSGAFATLIYNFLKHYVYYQGYKDDYLGLVEAWRWAKYRFLVNLALAVK